RKPGRLIDDDRRRISIEHEAAQHLLVLRSDAPRRRWRCRTRRGLGERRHPDRLTRLHRIAGPRALAVDPDLPGAQQPFEPPVVERGVMPAEPAIEPPGAVFRSHRYNVDAGHVSPAARWRSLSQ